MPLFLFDFVPANADPVSRWLQSSNVEGGKKLAPVAGKGVMATHKQSHTLSKELSCQQNWLVVSTHRKNISQIENLPQIGVKIKNI